MLSLIVYVYEHYNDGTMAALLVVDSFNIPPELVANSIFFNDSQDMVQDFLVVKEQNDETSTIDYTVPKEMFAEEWGDLSGADSFLTTSLIDARQSGNIISSSFTIKQAEIVDINSPHFSIK